MEETNTSYDARDYNQSLVSAFGVLQSFAVPVAENHRMAAELLPTPPTFHFDGEIAIRKAIRKAYAGSK